MNDDPGLDLVDAYQSLRNFIAPAIDSIPPPTLPESGTVGWASTFLPRPGTPSYLQPLGSAKTLEHILGPIALALNGQALSSRYFGFVTGGTLPIAEAADNVVSALDQNVQVHLEEQTIATSVEDSALRMLVRLLDLEGDAEDLWRGRTFTTGATASNVLGLACGREAVLARRAPWVSVGEMGLPAACSAAGVREIQVLTSMGHSSLSKAAGIVGLGRASVKQLPFSRSEPWRLNLTAVEGELRREGVANIISISAGEVNTGKFALTGKADMEWLRKKADEYGAWIHVDAFGMFVRALPATNEFRNLREMAAGLELADSITLDCHKLLNVPYDCGVFVTRSLETLTAVCTNPNAAYLSSSTSAIPSPLNIGIENSRRFRALPAYAVLLSEGRDGLGAMLVRMVRLARKIALFIQNSEHYVLLPDETPDVSQDIGNVNIIVLFRAKDESLNEVLVERINETRQMYVSGTVWKGQKAVRIAVSSWRVDVERDFAAVRTILAIVSDEALYNYSTRP